MAQPYRDRALVVRRYDFNEADRIIVLLTREHGIVRAVAKGVRRAKSRFGSRLSPFIEVDVLVYPGRNLGTIAGADTVQTWAPKIVSDVEAYTAACGILEVAQNLTLEPDPALFDLTTRCLAQLTRIDPDMVVAAYLLQAMQHTGWAPSLFACASCGKAGPHSAFDASRGGALCTYCRTGGSGVETEVLRLMWHLSRLNFADNHAVATIAEVAGVGEQDRESGYLLSRARKLATAHLEYHLDRRIGALKMAL